MKQPGNAQHVWFLLCQIGQEWRGMQPDVLPVPFISHSTDQSAAAALAMILRYYGHPSPTPGVNDDLLTAWCDRDMPRQLVTAARDCGLDAGVTAGNINRLMDWLQQGVPVLVFPESDLRGAGDPVAVVTGLTRDRTAVCLHYGANPHTWLPMPDFLALCGGETFTAVPVAERHLYSHARTRSRARPTGQTKSWLNLLPDPISAMAA